jgi:hypothetical protein
MLPILLATFFLGCGGGGGGSAPAPASSFTVATATLTLPVPPAANVDAANSYYPAPYSGTVTLTVNRSAGLTGAVTLTVNQAQLPSGLKANFANATDTTGASTIVPASATTATLSIQAGYPDPSDSTFTKQIYPAQGSYTIPIAASASGVTGTNGSLALSLIQEPADFGLIFSDSTDSSFYQYTNISMVGTTLTEYLTAYWATGTYTGATWGPVALSASAVPAHMTVNITNYNVDPTTGTDICKVTITSDGSLAAGTYSFLISGTYLGVTHTLPVVVTYSPYPFSIQMPLSSTVTVSQGQTVAFPVYLWHNDAYYDGTTTTIDGDPTYVGSTNLSVSGVTSGLTVGFSNADPTGLASVPLSISASATAPVGSTTVYLQATRVGTATTAAAPLPLRVTVTSSATPTVWIQNVEWGQTVVTPNLRLVGGKPALLRVQLLADRTGVSAPTVTATIKNQSGTTVDTVTLLGPATVPTTVNEGDLPTAAGASATTYAAILPAADIQPGMQATIAADTLTQTLSPSVDPGSTLNLVAVPITCKGVTPVLPADSVMSQELAAFWPVQSVNVTRRAPYTTSTVIPAPSGSATTDTSFDGWIQLLNEVASLKIVDGITANYYGFFNPSIPANFKGGTVVGLSPLGSGVGIGIDATTARSFLNEDPTLDLATTIMVHEEGHAFNLNHAPAGGAASPQLNYPYATAATGTWGFDPVTLKAYDPTTNFDVMSYASATHWISDWDYLSAMGFLGEQENPSASLGAAMAAAATEQWVVSGVVQPDGQIRLSPLVRAVCLQVPPTAGELSLVLKSAATTRTISFSAVEMPDLPAGYRHFAFSVPAADELTSAEVRTPGGQTSRRMSASNVAWRTQALAASAQDGSLVMQESGGSLHLEWDAQAHPFVNVLYEGANRTTLGLNLTGGSADLSLAGLPAGGQFVVHYSDGLNAVTHRAMRPTEP